MLFPKDLRIYYTHIHDNANSFIPTADTRRLNIILPYWLSKIMSVIKSPFSNHTIILSLLGTSHTSINSTIYAFLFS